jgi:hypothetical protein
MGLQKPEIVVRRSRKPAVAVRALDIVAETGNRGAPEQGEEGWQAHAEESKHAVTSAFGGELPFRGHPTLNMPKGPMHQAR